ncbi:DUF2332 family protein [Paracoccus limosus]|uniref:DUF2332 family protein n=1 Tax=Paracoccus limosus TaxID=913252 RepID=A0A844H7L6_9RHOB|nr:DUF2332 family protein [Paracoccus limosus]
MALVLTDALPATELNGGDLVHVFQGHDRHFLEWISRAPQTNEVGRAAVLIAASRFLAGLGHDDLDLLELGASAGLNLNFPLYHLDPERMDAQPDGVILTPDWHGTPPDPRPLRFGTARGVDLSPVDAIRDGLRLLAYVWPDQPQRAARLRAALAIACQHPPQVDQGDAAPWLATQLARPAQRGRMVYHTVAAQYFPAESRARIETLLHETGAATTPGKPLCHVSMESAGPEGMALQLRLWDKGRMRSWNLGRAHAHAQWIDWRPRETT